MAVEIQQRLERDYEINLALTDIKKITVGELKEFRDGNKDGLKQYSADLKKVRANLSMIRFDIPTEPTTLLNDVKTGIQRNIYSIYISNHKLIKTFLSIHKIFKTSSFY
jgi:hypothetical protein